MSQPPNTDQTMNQSRPNNFPPPGVRTWTPELIARFQVLLAQRPLLYYAAIAAQLSAEFGITLSKNACIGFGRRIGTPRREPGRKRPERKPQPRAPYVKKVRLEPRPRPKRIGKMLLVQLERGDCRWPLGDGPPFFFCGAPQLDSCSYCLKHAHIAYPALRRQA